ncbi:hypothetical protein J6590_053395 [Homalodisca vitripennis]|nr:hypothetical protein J6590_053395 [Homalodisca vitripennis]
MHGGTDRTIQHEPRMRSIELTIKRKWGPFHSPSPHSTTAIAMLVTDKLRRALRSALTTLHSFLLLL